MPTPIKDPTTTPSSPSSSLLMFTFSFGTAIQQANSTMVTSTNSSNSGSDDAFFLSFGSSVNVCEEQRRAIRKDIDQLDSGINDLQSHVGGEEQSNRQVQKDLAHAKKEMFCLKRTLKEQLETETNYEVVTNQLKEALGAKMFSIFFDGGNNIEEKDPENQSPKDFVEARAETIKRLEASEAEKESYAQKVNEESARLAEKANEIEHLIVSERLESNVADSAKGLDEKEKDFQTEKRRRLAIEAAIQHGRNESGRHAQEIADLVRNKCDRHSSTSLVVPIHSVCSHSHNTFAPYLRAISYLQREPRMRRKRQSS